jgi:prepilin-type N-terminal cleavage/methylation domain-containing protein/prepilin-type processing-associated H-X9-DG protein
MRHPRIHAAFTLIELLVVVGIIAILAGLLIGALPSAIQHAYSASCAAHIRSMSLAFVEYAGDNNNQLPGRVTDSGSDKWPVLLLPYLQDPKVYVDPGDPVARVVPTQSLVSNTANNSSFFFNGFNDLGAYTNQSVNVTLASLTNTSNLILIGQKVHGSTQYYMDFVEGNENDVLNKTAYFGGSNYGFADGSVRFMKLADYSDQMWLVNPAYQIPTQ